MGDISKYFNRKEFECHCKCGYDTVDTKLVEILDELRHHFGVPVKINSGCRCEAYNRAVGGTVKSKHLLGIAADIMVAGEDPKAVYAYLDSKYPNTFGLGLYSTFVHVDVRSKRGRW